MTVSILSFKNVCKVLLYRNIVLLYREKQSTSHGHDQNGNSSSSSESNGDLMSDPFWALTVSQV